MLFVVKKKKTPNYGKIIGITAAAVTGACAVAFFTYKLVLKLKEKEAAYDEDLCEGCPIADECNGECPIEELTVEEEAPAEEAVEATEEK